jgi:dipeptidyl aminopeptidase/acylaminoacyl peptidase
MKAPKTCTLLNLTLIVAFIVNPARAADEPSDQGSRRITLADFGAVHSPRSPRISPDGSRITYVHAGQIFLVSADDPEPRPITSSATEAWGHRWAADGDSIYFLSSRDDTTQIYKLPIDEPGEATQLTFFKHGVASINLSPDEQRVLLEIGDNELREVADDAEPQPFVITRRQFKRDSGNGYIVEGDTKHLYVYDIETRGMTQITSGIYDERDAAWSPDGSSIVFVSNREKEPDAGYRTDLWIVAAGSTEEEAALVRLTNTSLPKHSPAFSPDGESIAYLTAEDGVYGVYHLALIPAAGGEPRVLTAVLDRWVTSFEYSKDGEWIYFGYYDSGARDLARVRVSDGKIEKLIDDDQVVRSFDVSETGVIAAAVNNHNDATDIYSLRRGRLTRLTDLNRGFFEEHDLGDKVKVSFENPVGTRIEAFITTPPDYEPGRAYPAILHIHGGPQGQFSWGFSFKPQFFAGKGYVVIEPNPRGSLGRGQDFLRAIYRGWGVPDYDDVIAAVDYAVAEGIADPDRLAVTGYSYGGYMTNVVITQTTRFKAAASGAGHSLIEANVGHDIYQKWYLWELGFPWENRERYDVHSPLLRAGNVTTPTLFLGGRIDWNVPILNAELFYQALTWKGVDTELVVYPGAHHGGWPESFEKDYLTRIADWFDLYVGVDPTDPPNPD